MKKGAPRIAQISKLEGIFSKISSQLEFGVEHLFCGTVRGVIFRKRRASFVYARS